MSSQFFFSGQQILARALRQMPNGSARDALLQLGGNAVLATGDYANDQVALVYVALPHQIPSSLGDTDHALPTDLLTSQIQITCELNPAAAFWSINGSATVGAPPSAFDNAYFQVQQLQFDSQDSSLARRIDMNTHAYAMPLPSFDQQVVQIPLGAGAGSTSTPASLVASGFRAGEVRAIQAWLTRTGDTSGATKNFGAWYNPKSITMLYAGEVYARFEDGSSQLWNLVNGTAAPAANTVLLTWNGSTAYTTGSGALQQWCMLPFSQPHLQEATTNVLVGGKAVTNGIINLQVLPPSAGDDWVINLVYVYNSTLLFSKGTCDYVF